MMNRLWIGLTVMAVAGLLLFGLLLRKRYRKMQEIRKGYQPPQMRFRYTEKEIAEECEALGQQGRTLLRQFDWLFVPMLFYVGMALAVVTRNAAQYEWMAWAMYGLAIVGCLLGMIETVLLVAEKLAAKAASVCSLLKWICFGIWVAGMFVGLFIRSTAL